ncbi:MAG TPA: hypothetical protein VJM32_03525 [Candidatus Saccharimonadales bacterium]|nr:hypothetical protein [Candidatus Saccharimonadales bacterium]
MHWIQKHILQQLSTQASGRYIELKPDSIDGNLFMYHIQQLQRSGYVSKEGHTYQLSEKGKIFASRMSLRQGSPLVQPKIVVMLICQNAKGQYLLFRWRRQPYLGLVSFPFSKQHFGRTLEVTLQEALMYKTQLSGGFAYIGGISLRILNDKGETAEHTLAHLYKVTDAQGTLGAYDGLPVSPFGVCLATCRPANRCRVLPRSPSW